MEPTLDKYHKLQKFTEFRGGLFSKWSREDQKASQPIKMVNRKRK
jgi:hypothetical protein